MMTSSPSSGAEKRNQGQVQVLSRAVRILRALRDTDGLTLAQLAVKTRLPRTTVYRIVATLEAEGLLTTLNPGGRVQLGLDFISLAMAVRHDLRRELRPYLEELSLLVDETVDLSVLDHDHLIFLDQVTRLKRLRAVSGTGMFFPLHSTANGKALLATLADSQIHHLLPETLPTSTPNTIPHRAQLLEELTHIRRSGIAYDREEHTLGICAVSIAVRAPIDTLVAISIPVPSVRFYGNEEQFVSALRQTGDRIRRLSFNAPQASA